MPFAIIRRGQYVMDPLPQWGDQPRIPVQRQALIEAVHKHSPQVVVLSHPLDSMYVLVPLPVLRAAAKRALYVMAKEGVRYVNNAWDCENYVNELHQVIRKMAAQAGITSSPLTACLSVRQEKAWAQVPSGGGHAVAAVMTTEGLVICESQNGETIPFDMYPNRANAFEIGNH